MQNHDKPRPRQSYVYHSIRIVKSRVARRTDTAAVTAVAHAEEYVFILGGEQEV
jgi:hypothetical protein